MHFPRRTGEAEEPEGEGCQDEDEGSARAIGENEVGVSVVVETLWASWSLGGEGGVGWAAQDTYASEEAPERGNRGRDEGLVDVTRAGDLDDVVASVGAGAGPRLEGLFEAERAVAAEGVAGGSEPGAVGVGGGVETAEHDEHF